MANAEGCDFFSVFLCLRLRYLGLHKYKKKEGYPFLVLASSRFTRTCLVLMLALCLYLRLTCEPAVHVVF